MRNTPLHIKLTQPEITKIHLQKPRSDSGFESATRILTTSIKFKEDVVVGFLADGVEKSPDLGRLFSQIQPRAGGLFTMELAVELANRLPSVQGVEEMVFDVSGDGDDNKTLCVSNCMGRISFQEHDGNAQILGPQYDIYHPDRKLVTTIPSGASIDYPKSMAASTYEVKGRDAEEALASHIESAIHDFMQRINRLSIAHILLNQEEWPRITPVYDHATFNLVYVAMTGRDPDRSARARLCFDIREVGLGHREYNAEESAALRSMLNGSKPIDEALKLLYSGKSYLDGGVLDFALLLFVIAAEIATARFVRAGLLEAGVSKAKLNSAKRDMTFNKMLNIDLWPLCPTDNKPNKDVIGRINWGRERRNDLMHEGKFKVQRSELIELFESSRAFIDYLSSLIQSGMKGVAQ